MPKTAFPISKTRSFQLGKKWRWRVDLIGLDGANGRLLTAFEPSAEKYLAWLSLERDGGHAIVARYEFHGDEPGWHCHSLCGDVDKVPVALVKPYGTIRLPKARKTHRQMTYGVTEQNALAIAFKVFRIENMTEDALI